MFCSRRVNRYCEFFSGEIVIRRVISPVARACEEDVLRNIRAAPTVRFVLFSGEILTWNVIDVPGT